MLNLITFYKFSVTGGISLLAEYLRSKILKWKIDSLKKCNYKCVISNKRSDLVHHLYGFEFILNEIANCFNLNTKEFKINTVDRSTLEKIEEMCLNLHYKYGLGVALHPKIHDLFHSKYNHNHPFKGWFELNPIRV